MSEKVTISYRGAAYELGRGKRSYGIWASVTPRTEPVARFPETPEGWVAAWTRFAALETPGTIMPVGRAAAAAGAAGADVLDTGGADSARSMGIKSAPVAAGLLGGGVLLGLIGLFPGYLSKSSLASTPVNLVPHVFYLAAWTISAVLIAFGGVRRQAGALLGLGTSVVTFGLFCVDMAEVAANHPHHVGAGLILSLLGWLACAAGSEIAFRLRSAGSVGIPRGSELARVALIGVAGIGAIIAYAPAWDNYLLRFSTNAIQSQNLGAGNAFSEGAWLTTASIIVMVLVLAVVAVAALWRPFRLGGVLLAGAAIPLAAQAVSAIIQATEPTPPSTFDISQAQATQYGLSITNGLTPAFWIYCLFVVVLAVSCIWMLITPPSAVWSSGVTAAAAPGSPAAESPTSEFPVAEPVTSEFPVAESPVSGAPADEPAAEGSAVGEPATGEPATATLPVVAPAGSSADFWDQGPSRND
jgi:hypothetical protein